MTTMIRKQIYIEARQELLLKQLANETGTSEAEIIRYAIDTHTRRVYKAKPDLTAWEAERVYILSRIAQGPIAGGRIWKREELYER